MKLIYSLIIGLLLVSSSQAQVLDVPTVEQEQDLWCWVGISKSAIDYYSTSPEQCEIVEWVRQNYGGYGNQPCCENPSGPCNSTNNIGGEGDGGVQDVIKHYLGYNTTLKSFSNVQEQDIAVSIANNKVVPCAWQYYPAGGHAVLIHGYDNGNVYYMNPWFGEGKKITPYSSFVSGNEGQGSHSWTFSVFIDDNVSSPPISCTTPSNFQLSDVGSTYARATWTEVPGAKYYNVRFRAIGSSAWSHAAHSSDSSALLIKNLNPSTNYELQIASVCDQSNSSSYSASQYITTISAANDYCLSASNGTFMSWIKNVKLGSIDHSYPRDYEYMDFTHISTDLVQGSTNPMTLTYVEQDLYGQREYWSVYIDWNQDKDFDDPGEVVYRPGSSAPKVLNLNLVVPSNALQGRTRMRITIGRSQPTSPCGTVSAGEVEDYTLNIIPNGPPTCDVVDNLASNNVSHNSFTASWTASSNASSYDVAYRVAGGNWTTVNTAATSYNFSGLTAETQYEVNVTALCGFGNSPASNNILVTTLAEPVCETVNNLTASNVSNNSFTASWFPSANATSYDVAIREVGGSWNTTNTASSTFSFNNLTAETQYELKVTTICDFGNSPASVSISVTTTAAPVCAVVNNLSTSNLTHNSFTASWSASANALSYDLEYREAGGNWTTVNTSATSHQLTGLNAETQYEVRVITVCDFGNSAASNSVLTTTNSAPLVYCNSSGSSTAGEWIEKISIGGINNTSGANGGYADFTSQSTSIEEGTTVALTLSPGFPYNFFFGYTTQPVFWSVWIDLNQDKDFNDANEQVYVSPSSNSSANPLTVNITVPTGTPAGSTRMRIALKRNAAASSCESFANGEVEDYTVNITPASAPVCATPSNLQSSGIGTSDATLSWSSVSSALSYILRYREAGQTWNSITTSANSYTLSGLSSNTTYEWSVKSDCGSGNESAESSVISFTTANDTPPNANYCESRGNNAATEWIGRVTIGDLNNVSNNNSGYGDFTNLTINANQGQNISFSLVPHFYLFGYSEYWKIWVDYNQDNDFDDVGELAFTSGGSSATVNGSFNIPASALTGSTRLRVQMKYNASSSACETFARGEVEDYTINIGGIGALTTNLTQYETLSITSVYPNPATDVLRINGEFENAEYKIITMAGRQVQNGIINPGKALNIDALAPGSYILQLSTKNEVSQHAVVVK